MRQRCDAHYRERWSKWARRDTAQSTLHDMLEGILEENRPETPSQRSSQQLKRLLKKLLYTKFALLIAFTFTFNSIVSQKECFVWAKC